MQRPDLRPRLFDSTMFILLLSGPPRFRDRDPLASLRGEMDLVVLLHVAVWSIGFAWVLYRLYPLVVRRNTLPRLGVAQLSALGLLAVLCLSLPTAPGFLLTSFSIFQFAVMLGFSYVFARTFGVRAYLHHLFAGFVILTGVLIATWLIAPEMVVRGIGGRVRGDSVAPAGAVAVFTLMLALSGITRLKGRYLVPIIGAGIVLLAAAQTRTAFLAFAVFLAVGWLAGSRLPIRKAIPYVASLLLVAAVMDFLPITRQFVIRDESTITNMSDRVPLWEYMIGVMLRESPLVGMGYYSASRVIGPEYNPRLGNAHSAFVEVVVGGGLAGGALFLLLYTALLAGVIRLMLIAPAHPVIFSLASLLMVVLIFSITGSEGIHAGPVGFTFWSLTALVPLAREQLLQPAEGFAALARSARRPVGLHRQGTGIAPVRVRPRSASET